jgi:hypothetical protein
MWLLLFVSGGFFARCASDETVSGFFKAFSYVYSCFLQNWLFPSFPAGAVTCAALVIHT